MSNKNKKSTIKKTTKQDIVTDFKTLFSLYKTTGANRKGTMSRNWYRTNSKYGEEYVKFFNTFEELEKEAFGEDIDKFKNEKINAELRRENSELRRDKDKLLYQTISDEKLLELYKESIVNIKIPKELKIIPIKNDSNKEAILMISDIHFPSVIVLDHINGVNEYNSEIMKKRLDRIFYYLVFYCKKNDIKKVTIAVLGDVFSGIHHEDLIRTNEMDEVSALFYFQDYFITKLLEIQNYFSEIICEFVVGNHSRIPQGKPQLKLAGILNYEYILAKQLQLVIDLIQKDFKIKKIKINVHNSLFKVIEVAKRRFFITHGHMLSQGSNSFAGIPYYGLSMSGGKMYGYLTSTDLGKDDFSDILMGHLHCSSKVKIPSGNLYINGSVIGTDELSLFKMKSVAESEQTLLIVCKGKVINEIILRGENY
jgi:predicted phosphodiesterase